jgi:hypothetical protein
MRKTEKRHPSSRGFYAKEERRRPPRVHGEG